MKTFAASFPSLSWRYRWDFRGEICGRIHGWRLGRVNECVSRHFFFLSFPSSLKASHWASWCTTQTNEKRYLLRYTPCNKRSAGYNRPGCTGFPVASVTKWENWPAFSHQRLNETFGSIFGQSLIRLIKFCMKQQQTR